MINYDFISYSVVMRGFFLFVIDINIVGLEKKVYNDVESNIL